MVFRSCTKVVRHNVFTFGTKIIIRHNCYCFQIWHQNCSTIPTCREIFTVEVLKD